MGNASEAETTSRRTVGARTGGRSERVVRDVLQAAIDELSKTGYGALRVDDVAVRAGVNKTTVYRRWPTKAELVAAAISTRARHHEALPDTGSVRGDLLEMVARLVTFVRTNEGRAITRLLAVESGDPDVDRLGRSLRHGIMNQRAKIIERAQQRGELPADLDARLVVDAIFAPIATRILLRREDLDTATAEAFVDLVLAGAKHVAPQARTGT
jgi:AcrR family transcriptional regulator